MSTRSNKRKMSVSMAKLAADAAKAAVAASRVQYGPVNRPSRRQNRARTTKGGRAGAKRRPAGVRKNLGQRGVLQGKVYSVHVPECTECIGTFSTSVAFANTDYVINPSNSATFPRLSQMAALFELYDFEKLEFKFVSTSATAVASTNTALGSIMMNTNYDVTDSAFASQSQMENYGGITEARPSVTSVHRVQVAGMKGGLKAPDSSKLLRYNLVESGATPTYPSNTSAHDYDLGRFQIASSGAQAASVAGRLYVTYKLNLHRWKVDTPLGQSIIASHIAELAAGTAAASGSAFLGTSGGTMRSGSTIPIVTTNSTFTLPLAGRFLVAASFNGSVTVVPTFTAGSAITAINAFAGSSASTVAGVSANTAVKNTVYDVATPGTGAANTITISGLTNLAGGNADIFVCQISSGLASDHKSSEHDTAIHQELSELRQSVSRLLEERKEVPSTLEVVHMLKSKLRLAKIKLARCSLVGGNPDNLLDQIKSLQRRIVNVFANSDLEFKDDSDSDGDEWSIGEHIVCCCVDCGGIHPSNVHMECECENCIARSPPHLVREQTHVLRRSPTLETPRVNLTMSAADLLERIRGK